MRWIFFFRKLSNVSTFLKEATSSAVLVVVVVLVEVLTSVREVAVSVAPFTGIPLSGRDKYVDVILGMAVRNGQEVERRLIQIKCHRFCRLFLLDMRALSLPLSL